jgi:hypothetical protein
MGSCRRRLTDRPANHTQGDWNDKRHTANPISETLKSLRLADEIRELKAEIKRLNAEVSKAQARSEIAVAALAVGVPPSSLEDVVSRAENAGDQLSVVGPAEWIKSLRSTARHLFTQPEIDQPYAPPGTTAQPTQPTGGSGSDLRPGEKNPWTDADWHDTQQALIINSDPARAARLAAAAGSYVGAMPPGLRKSSWSSAGTWRWRRVAPPAPLALPLLPDLRHVYFIVAPRCWRRCRSPRLRSQPHYQKRQ